MSLPAPGLKCGLSAFILFIALYQQRLPLPFPALLPGREPNAVLGTANYHFGFLRWCHLGLREVGATYPSAQQETGHQLQEHWGCSMDLAWRRPQEGTRPLLPCLLRTLKKKKNSSQHHASLPQTHMACGRNLHIADVGDNPAGDNWTSEMTGADMNFSKPQIALRGV